MSFAALTQHRFASKKTPYQTPTLLCYLTSLCPCPESLYLNNLRKHVFDAVHSLSHPGIRASIQLICERFVWEGMQKDIAEFTRAYVFCQQSKIHRHNSASLQSFLQPDLRFSAKHCNLVGPLYESCGDTYLLTIIDRFTKHLECIPLREITVKACADSFVLNWVARLPGQFFEPSSETPRTKCCAQLCQFMLTLRAPPPHHHGTPRSYVEKALQTCAHVFVKNDTARSSFDRPYKGPYTVLNKGDKFFTLDLFSRRDIVSIDRLQAAHLVIPDSEHETHQRVEGCSQTLP